jgi:menaquinol-cytochrome c reductase iron-sulfur subunit
MTKLKPPPPVDEPTALVRPRTRGSRRRFLARLTAGVSAAIAAVAGIPLLGTVLSPLLRPTHLKGAQSQSLVAELHELEAGVPKRVEIIQRTVDAWSAHDRTVLGAVWLLKRSDGEVDAFSTICPHLGCGVNFEGGIFRCPCHTSAFRSDGSVMAGPAPRGMDRIAVEVRENKVYVRYVRFKQGTSQREEV